jgi:hypothetical protein
MKEMAVWPSPGFSNRRFDKIQTAGLIRFRTGSLIRVQNPSQISVQIFLQN